VTILGRRSVYRAAPPGGRGARHASAPRNLPIFIFTPHFTRPRFRLFEEEQGADAAVDLVEA
jgi:hypothetical protein